MINKNWLFNVYREEASDDGDQGGGDNSPSDADNVSEMVNGETPETPDWLLPKYMTEGKELNDAIADQAKSYSELQKRFGSFTGAPEEYEVSLADEISEAGFELDKESDLYKDAVEFAKSTNMNQEGFNKLVSLWATSEIAMANAQKANMEEAFKNLENGQDRVNNIAAWANKSLPADMVPHLDGLMTTPENVKLVERLISMSRQAPVNPDNFTPNDSVTETEVREMQFAVDEHGNRKINTDAAFRKEYERKRNLLYGTEEHRNMIG